MTATDISPKAVLRIGDRTEAAPWDLVEATVTHSPHMMVNLRLARFGCRW
jgi:hypothetical protein